VLDAQSCMKCRQCARCRIRLPDQCASNQCQEQQKKKHKRSTGPLKSPFSTTKKRLLHCFTFAEYQKLCLHLLPHFTDLDAPMAGVFDALGFDNLIGSVVMALRRYGK